MNEVVLGKEEIPKYFYNILPDLPIELPPPRGEGVKILGKIFPKALLEQEMSTERYIRIPDEVRELYSKNGRPTPLYRATGLEKALNTPAKIFYKREDVNLSGSHKLNTAIAQAYYIKKEGFKKVVTETGAGQWGTALSIASALFGLECKVYMVRCSYDQKPYRKYIMKMYGADIKASPSADTETGRSVLKDAPNSSGSLGIAISEAIEEAVISEDTVYSLGSVLNHVLLHQTVIGEEVKKQLSILGEESNYLIGCVGGGSNFSGFCFPFMKDVINGELNSQVIAVEPVEVPSLTGGDYRYDYGDFAEQTPELMMYTLGCKSIPNPIYAGGLRYHGAAPILSLLKKTGHVKSETYGQDECFKAAELFTRTEGIIPAPETSHAITSAIHHALDAKKTGKEETIVFNFSGHGLLDMEGYADVLKY